ncbi:MAG: hypothetical protein CL878_04225 [Dehalococcoidia bacterium]|nr:hypothetical protein [Dehalococcoidia bacterium]
MSSASSQVTSQPQTLKLDLPPLIVNARPSDTAASGYVTGVDIGGTHQTAALATLDGRLVAAARCDLRAGGTADDVYRNVLALIEHVRAGAEPQREETPRLVRVGVGFGGPVDPRTGTIITSHHVPGWDRVPRGSLLAEALDTPVVVENDANAAALAEALIGAGRGADVVLYANIGTGIGGGVVIGGQLYRGETGQAGEIGHTTVQPDGPACTCGRRGCLEALASGRTLDRRAQSLAADYRAGAAVRAAAGDDGLAVSGKHLLVAAGRGDAAALAVIEEAAAALGFALGNAANLLNPGRIVIGGGVATAGEVLLAPIRAATETYLLPSLHLPQIVAAALGYEAGVAGALALALQGS